MRIGLILLLSAAVYAQTVDRPARGVTDPGVVTTRQSITPAGVPTVFQGRVYGVSFHTANELDILTGAGVYRMDWAGNKVLRHTPAKGRGGIQAIDGPGPAWLFQRDSKVWLHRGDDARGVELGRFQAGSVRQRGGRVFAALAFENKLAVIDAANTVTKLDTGIAPVGLAVNATGSVAWVGNWGGRVPKTGEPAAPTGLAPTAGRVVVDARGVAASGTVTRLDIVTGKTTDTVPVGLHPTALAWDEPRERLYVANTNSDSVSVIDTKAHKTVATWPLQPFSRKAFGVAPTALAISADGARLYVACGGINAVMILKTANGAMEGAIPTFWYPGSLALSPEGKRLAVGAVLGVGSGWSEKPERRFVHSNRGAVQVIDLPTAPQLASWTTAVAENNHMAGAAAPVAPSSKPSALPARSGDPSLIEHVVYIIKENRTYDQVFGDIGKGNSDPSLTMFGRDVTPNQHKLAEQFVLLDNFYATGGNSADGHQWATQANETAYCLWPGYEGRSYPFDGTDPLAYSSSGFLWDYALARGRSVRVYGEYAGHLADDHTVRKQLLEGWRRGEKYRGRWNIKAPIEKLNTILAPYFPSYSHGIPDVVRAQIFLEDVAQWEKDGKMPNLTIMLLPSDHTAGTRPGSSTPKSMVADNDLAVGQIVEGLTKTKFWKKMAIFVVEDDAQNGVDHVDGHRTTALAISPYIKRGHIDSTFYSHQSMLKSIELILGLPTMSLFDLIANEMRDSFTDQPDFAGFTAETPRQSLFDVNPPLAALKGKERDAARASLKMKFDVPDAVPTEKLNRILWGSIRGWNTPYPKPPRAVFAPITVEKDDDDDDR